MNKVNSSAVRKEINEAMLQRKYIKSKTNKSQATLLIATAIVTLVGIVVLITINQ